MKRNIEGEFLTICAVRDPRVTHKVKYDCLIDCQLVSDLAWRVQTVNRRKIGGTTLRPLVLLRKAFVR